MGKTTPVSSTHYLLLSRVRLWRHKVRAVTPATLCRSSWGPEAFSGQMRYKICPACRAQDTNGRHPFLTPPLPLSPHHSLCRWPLLFAFWGDLRMGSCFFLQFNISSLGDAVLVVYLKVYSLALAHSECVGFMSAEILSVDLRDGFQVAF